MKLRDLSNSTLIFEVRQSLVVLLSESISDYMSTVLAKLKAKKPEELFDGDKPEISLDRLASLVAGLKVLGTSSYRQAMTKDDLGIDPNNVKDFAKLLDSIPRDGKNIPQLTVAVFTALKVIAPKIFKTEREAMDKLKSDQASERTAKIADLQKFSDQVNKIFKSVREKSTASKSTEPAKDGKLDAP